MATAHLANMQKFTAGLERKNETVQRLSSIAGSSQHVHGKEDE